MCTSVRAEFTKFHQGDKVVNTWLNQRLQCSLWDAERIALLSI